MKHIVREKRWEKKGRWNLHVKKLASLNVHPSSTMKIEKNCFQNFGSWVIFKDNLFQIIGMQTIQPKYRYIRQGGTRSPRNNNNAFYFILKEQKVKVCKLFYKNTLDVHDRPIRTAWEKQNKIANILLEEDRWGKHGKHVKVDDNIRDDIKHISSIPKIESHYARYFKTF